MAADPTVLRKLVWPLRLTLWGMRAEALVRAFWPLWSVLIAGLAVLMLGLQDLMILELVWALGMGWMLGVLAALWRGLRALRWPDAAAALDRLDATLPGRPIGAMLDAQAIGGADPASAAVWRAHQARMAARAATARAVDPDLRLSARDPFALRYVAAAALAVALVFGSVGRVGSVAGLAPGATVIATGPTWEGWIAPPSHTGLPVLYLSDLPDSIDVPKGATVTLRFYGEVGDLMLAETVSARTAVPPASDPQQEFTITQDGRIEILGRGGRAWNVAVVPDRAPVITPQGAPEVSADGMFKQGFTATDDYAVTAGRARIALDLAAVDRRFGLAADPEPRPAIDTVLPLPIAGDRSEIRETLAEDFSDHPFANLPVTLELFASDALDQEGASNPVAMTLRARRFFDPLAGSIVEMRRDLLWTRENAPRVAQVLRAISHRPGEGVFKRETDYLRLRGIVRRLENSMALGLTVEQRDEIAQALWDFALELEEGDIDSALTRMQEAQERLNEAMKNGASEQEIARLMQELRDATDDYIRQLAQQARRDAEANEGELSEDNSLSNPDAMQMTQNDLQRMMDRIQELMEQGRMAEAQQALQELQEMMENMRVTQGQGQGPQSEGQRAMEGLSDTLREQQGLSDQAFRDLQRQYNPNSGQQQGQQQGQQPGQQPGRQSGQQPGGQGQGGQDPNGQDPNGQDPNGQGQGNQQAENGQDAPDSDSGTGSGDLAQSLADRQQALRDELNRQRGALPGTNSEAGQAARDALDRAGRAMDGAEQALRQDDLAGAIDQQGEAMQALREGIRNLGQELAEADRGRQPGQNGQAMGDPQGQARDPLGRRPGADGRETGSDQSLLQGEDVYRRAQDLLDQIRRRSGETERPEVERDYLRRLLERF